MTTDTVGGVWTYAVDLIRGLRPHGVTVALATAGAPLSPVQRRQAEALPNVVLFESDDKLEWMADPWDDVRRTTEWLGRIAHEWQPDVVHLNSYAYGQHEFGVPVLTVGHSCVCSWFADVKGDSAPAEWNRYRDEVNRGLHSADLVVAPSRAMLDALHRHYGPLPNARVIYNGRDPAMFAAGPKDPVIFAAGRMWDEAKNVAALAAVAGRLPWPVRVAGDATGPDGRVVAFEGVTLLGLLDPPAMAAELSRASVYAFPARYEPFGLSVLEAALSGCALVLGGLPSLREIWGDAACYVPPDDTEALYAALARLCTDHAECERLSHAAVQHARQYTLEATTDAYLDAYRDLIAQRSGGPRRQPLPALADVLAPEPACES